MSTSWNRKGMDSASISSNLSRPPAKIYEQEVLAQKTGLEDLPNAMILQTHPRWTSEMRRRQSEDLNVLLELEKKAVSLICAHY